MLNSGSNWEPIFAQLSRPISNYFLYGLCNDQGPRNAVSAVFGYQPHLILPATFGWAKGPASQLAGPTIHLAGQWTASQPSGWAKGRVRCECDKCEYKATCKSDLTKHKQATHERVKYECNQCEYKSTWQSHIKSKHEGVRYECDQCECKAAWQSYLTDHIKSKHGGVRYECDQCEYKATYKGNLSKHKTWVRFECDKCEY